MKDIRRQVERQTRATVRARPGPRPSTRSPEADGRRRAGQPLIAVARPGARQVVRDYVALTKPKVQSLLLLTTVTTMYVAGDPSVGPRARRRCSAARCRPAAPGAVNHGTTATSTRRWRARPTGRCRAGRVAPAPRADLRLHARRAVGRRAAGVGANPLAAALSFSGFLGYVFVYTIWLKRRTPQNIVIGGAAGAVPPLVAWAATTGRARTALAFYLFAIVFFWTPPHFWALSLLMKDEYARVGVPMLPVVRGEAETRRQILLYIGPALRGDAAAVLRRRLRRRSTSSRRWRSTRVFIGGAVPPVPHARPRRPRCACTSSRCCTSRCCSQPCSWTRASDPHW